MEKKKELLFSLSKNAGDFVVEPVKRSSGKGGQKANKTSSGCRIYHPASGTQSLCYEERSFETNKKRAFERLCENPKFKTWLKIETSRRTGDLIDIEKKVEDSLRQAKVEVRGEDGRWREANDEDFRDDQKL